MAATYWKKSGKYLKLDGEYKKDEDCCCDEDEDGACELFDSSAIIPEDVTAHLSVTWGNDFCSNCSNWDFSGSLPFDNGAGGGFHYVDGSIGPFSVCLGGSLFEIGVSLTCIADGGGFLVQIFINGTLPAGNVFASETFPAPGPINGATYMLSDSPSGGLCYISSATVSFTW